MLYCQQYPSFFPVRTVELVSTVAWKWPPPELTVFGQNKGYYFVGTLKALLLSVT
jgi:hypothetical protein